MLTVIILFSVSGCQYGDKSESVKYETLDELRTALGAALLVPVDLPENFEPDLGWINGSYYNRVDAWEYNLSLFISGNSETDFFRQIAEGTLAVDRIDIYAYEPKHRLLNPKHPLINDRETESEKYKNLVSENKVWDIDGVTVAYDIKTVMKEESCKYYYEDETERKKPENIYPRHYEIDAYAVFEYEDIFYTIDLKAYGNIGETVENADEMAGKIIRDIIAGMI